MMSAWLDVHTALSLSGSVDEIGIFPFKQSEIDSQGISKSPEMVVVFNLSCSKTMCKLHFFPLKNIYWPKKLIHCFNLLKFLISTHSKHCFPCRWKKDFLCTWNVICSHAYRYFDKTIHATHRIIHLSNQKSIQN